MEMGLFIAIFSLILVAIILAIILLVIKMQSEENDLPSLKIGKKDHVLLEILVPRNNEKGPLHAESMFAALHGIYDHSRTSQDYVSFEITSKNKYILFYCWTPIHLKDFVEGQIYAQYPTVEIREAAQDYSHHFNPNYTLAGATLELNKNDVFPIKTFPNFEVDPLASITGVLSKVSKDEQIGIQMLIRPVSDEWQQKGINYVSAVKAGINPEGERIGMKILQSAFDFTKEIVRSATTIQPTEPAGKEAGNEIEISGPASEALSAIEQKVVKLGFETKIRIVVVVEDETKAKMKLNSVVSAFKQFNATNINGFSIKEILTDEEILKRYQERSFSKAGYILNIEELASIFHLPHQTVETPSIAWAGSKKGEPPSNLPIDGTINDQEITLFGKTNFRHFQQKFGIKSRDRRLHFYSIGKTGTGKSTMLENMIIGDISEGRGVAVVDPHGDLIDHVLEFIPEKRIQDVIYFAPADREYPVGFNILETVDPDLKSIVASGVVGIFKKIFGESWGPRLEYILRNTVLSLLDYPGATMLGITRILVDRVYRKKVVEQIKDPVIKDFWKSEFEQYDQKFRTEAVAPIQNKVGQFLSTSTVRNIVGQEESTIHIGEIMDDKRILLIDLGVGKVGEDVSALLGALMITKIQLAAMQRATLPEEQRTDFYLYVDEFQNFATESFATILSEARKYHLNLIMTNQYIAQMPEIVRDAVFGNIGTLVAFRVGATDADFLTKEFEPVFDANDLVNMDNYNIYVKMAIDGVTSNAFSARTMPPRTDRFHNRDRIIEFSRLNYSRNRGEIENKINRWAENLEEENIDLHKEDTRLGQEQSEKIKKLGYKKIKSLTGQNWYVAEDPNQPIEENKNTNIKKDNQSVVKSSLKFNMHPQAKPGNHRSQPANDSIYQVKPRPNKSFFDLNKYSRQPVEKQTNPILKQSGLSTLSKEQANEPTKINSPQIKEDFHALEEIE